MSWFQRKMKMVAARASDALAQAADIVAPTLYESRVDEFHHRWTTVSRFLETIMTRDLDPQEQRRLLLESHTRDSLQKLVLLICAEEHATDKAELTRHHTESAMDASGHRLQQNHQPQQSQGDQAPRACLEYLLERQLIPHLCDVGRRDAPSGIMSLAMQFISALLSRVNHPILPTREVHVSVVALLQAATKKEVDDPIVRKCLITLLNTLWKKLRCDPVQTEFFFLQADRASTEISDLVLFTALLPHMYATQKTGEKCREALVIAASIHERALSRFILTLTPFCHYAVNGVISAFDALPKTLPDTLTTRTSGGGNSGSSLVSAATVGLDTKLQLLAARLRFCCTLAMVGQYELTEANQANMSISSEILNQFRIRFLEGPLLDGLMHTSEATARTATVYARIILEEVASCCRDTNANPLLLVSLQFLVEQAQTQPQDPDPTLPIPSTTSTVTDNQRRLPLELLHRMDSLSSSLSIATMDLFTSLLELQNDFVDATLLGSASFSSSSSSRETADIDDASACRRASLSSSVLSPRGHAGKLLTDSAIWLASRFPDSAVAANAHIWKIQAFDSMARHVEIPVSSWPSDSDACEDQIVSLLSYIADAEHAACQRAPAVMDGYCDSDDEDCVSMATPTVMPSELLDSVAAQDANKRNRRDSEALHVSLSSSRTAATRNSMKPLKEVALTMSIASYSPVGTALCRSTAATTTATDSSSLLPEATLSMFVRLVLNRLERVLESSFFENLALSGLISVLAQKNQCLEVVFDINEERAQGQSIRSVLEEVHADAVRRTSRLANGHARLAEIRRKLVEENNEASLNDHEPETRLLCGFVVLEEILKELCSLLFAKERVTSLPVKPEGYYLEPKRQSVSQQLPLSSDPLAASGSGGGSSDASGGVVLSIGDEFEQLMADAESTMGSILASTTGAVTTSSQKDTGDEKTSVATIPQ